MKTFFLLLPALLLSLAFSIPTLETQPPSKVRTARLMDDPLVTDVVTYTNKARAKKGLKPLVMKEGLNEIAHGHSENMASGKVPFSHDGFKERYQKARAEYTHIYSFGENVSYGPHSGKEAVEQWMTSKHHKDNILGDFTSIGVGVATDKNGRNYFTQVLSKD